MTKRIWHIVVCLCLLAPQAFAQNIEVPRPFQRSDGRWGFVDRNHCWISSSVFQEVRSFSEGLAAVLQPNGWSFITHRGQSAFSKFFYFADTFSDGLANVTDRASGLMGFINHQGDYVIPPQFSQARPFSEGLAAVVMQGGSLLRGPYAFLNRAGQIIINPQAGIVVGDGFSSGRAGVNPPMFGGDELTSRYIDKSGRLAFGGQFSFINEFKEGIAYVIRRDSRSGELIDINGNTIVRLEPYSYALPFSEGLAAIASSERSSPSRRWGYIEKDGRMKIPAIYEDAWSFSEGLAAVKLDGKWGFIDRNGRQAIPAQFERIAAYNFNERLGFHLGQARVKLFGSDREVFIDRSGRVLTQPTCTAR